jgi:hypothetical protein
MTTSDRSGRTALRLAAGPASTVLLLAGCGGGRGGGGQSGGGSTQAEAA